MGGLRIENGGLRPEWGGAAHKTDRRRLKAMPGQARLKTQEEEREEERKWEG